MLDDSNRLDRIIDMITPLLAVRRPHSDHIDDRLPPYLPTDDGDHLCGDEQDLVKDKKVALQGFSMPS